MLKILNFILLFIGLVCSRTAMAQTLKSKDIIISSFIPDNFLGKYNIGAEYFFSAKNLPDKPLLSVALNGGSIGTKIANQNINGFKFSTELNLYGEISKSKKWNEYGGIKFDYGNFKNKTIGNNVNYYFAGIGTGVQTLIAKIIATKVNVDLGYMRNGLTNALLYNDRKEPFHSGVVIIFNLAIGVKL
jgi:hypothetical protein